MLEHGADGTSMYLYSQLCCNSKLIKKIVKNTTKRGPSGPFIFLMFLCEISKTNIPDCLR